MVVGGHNLKHVGYDHSRHVNVVERQVVFSQDHARQQVFDAALDGESRIATGKLLLRVLFGLTESFSSRFIVARRPFVIVPDGRWVFDEHDRVVGIGDRRDQHPGGLPVERRGERQLRRSVFAGRAGLFRRRRSHS